MELRIYFLHLNFGARFYKNLHKEKAFELFYKSLKSSDHQKIHEYLCMLNQRALFLLQLNKPHLLIGVENSLRYMESMLNDYNPNKRLFSEGVLEVFFSNYALQSNFVRLEKLLKASENIQKQRKPRTLSATA